MATPDPKPFSFADAMALLALRLNDKPQALACIQTAIAAELIRVGIQDAPQAPCGPDAAELRRRMDHAAALLRTLNGGGLTTDQRMQLMREINACLAADGAH